MDISIRIKENGKPTISIHKKRCGNIGRMKVIDINMFISEYRANNAENRKFVLSIRQNNQKQYKLTQFNCSLDELIEIRNSINKIIDTSC